MHFCGHLLRGGVDWNSMLIACSVIVASVTSYAEVWIEIWWWSTRCRHSYVTSYAEVWIEIGMLIAIARRKMSPPTRRCGLKFSCCQMLKDMEKSPPTRRCGLKLEEIESMEYPAGHLLRGGVDWNGISESSKAPIGVTSYAEVWIEICTDVLTWSSVFVTSYAEVWIEMKGWFDGKEKERSPPTRRCGLKYAKFLACLPGNRPSPPTRRCGLKSLVCSIHILPP